MAVKFDPTISLGSILTAVSMMSSVAVAWGSLQSTLATHTSEIKQLQIASIRHDTERQQDRSEIKDMIKDLKLDLRDMKGYLSATTSGGK